MDTNIERLIETISDAIKKKDEEIASLETDLKICKNRIEKLEKVNKDLQQVNINYSKLLRENIIYQVTKNIEKTDKTTKELTESDDERVKAAYKDGYGTAVAKMSACLQEMRFDDIVTVKQGPITLKVEQKSHGNEFEKALAENSGKCHFCIYSDDLLDKRLLIVSALSKTYEVPPKSGANYLDKKKKNKKRGDHITILKNISEDICRTLEDHLRGKQIGYSWDFV